MKANRLDLIEAYTVDRGSASLPELAEAFGVSINTIRRDIAELVQRGKIRKVYGGVTANDVSVTPQTAWKNSASASLRPSWSTTVTRFSSIPAPRRRICSPAWKAGRS